MNMETVTYYSECECGQIVEGFGQISRDENTLYGENCPKCGEEFTVFGWFDQCEECTEYHQEGAC